MKGEQMDFQRNRLKKKGNNRDLENTRKCEWVWGSGGHDERCSEGAAETIAVVKAI